MAAGLSELCSWCSCKVCWVAYVVNISHSLCHLSSSSDSRWLRVWVAGWATESNRSYSSRYDVSDLVGIPVVNGAFCCLPQFLGYATKKVPNTAPGKIHDVRYLLIPQLLLLVVSTDPAEWRKVHRGCGVQIKSARLDSLVDITIGHGCQCLVIVGYC